KHQNEELKAGKEKENPLQAIQQNSDAEEEMKKQQQQDQQPQEVTAPLVSSSGSEATRRSPSPVPPETLHTKELTDGLREQLEEETPLAATQSKSHGTTDPQSSPASAIAGGTSVTHDADEENATGRNGDEPTETVFTEDHQENQSRLANQSEGETGREGERQHKKTKGPKEEKKQIQVVEHSIENQGAIHEPGKEPQEIKRENGQNKHQNEELKAGKEKENPLQAIQQNSDAEEEMKKQQQQDQQPQEVTAPLVSSSGSEATRRSPSPVPPETLHTKELTDGLREQLEEETPLAATQSKSHGTTDPQSSPASAIAGGTSVTHDADEENATGRNGDEPTETVFTEDHQQHELPEEIQKEPAKDKNAVSTNDTATPGDSDDSTAASHTTSPLLLLLLVACAAAAVVTA
ncbi:mucin-associated surface protein (MASP), putative, partial [Trypanosoma cruzi]